MTRQEFIDDVNSFQDLIEFCRENNLDTCDDVIDGALLNEYIMRDISRYATWTSVLEYLLRIPTGFEYYRINGYGYPEEADSMFEGYKHDVMVAMDNLCEWDEEEEVTEAIVEPIESMENDIGDDRFLSIVRG